MPLEPRSVPPPPRAPCKRVAPAVEVTAGVRVRRRTWWAGPWGLALVLVAASLLAALLVGWILLWAFRDSGPRITLLVLGAIAFTGIGVVLAILWLKLWSQARLRNAEAAFLTATSHHLRTPLAGIRAAAQALELEGLDPGRRAGLREGIVRECDRLGLLVDNVVELARIDVEGPRFQEAALDLGALVEEVAETGRLVAETRGGRVELTTEERARCAVRGDRAALLLVLGNVVDNAVRHGTLEPGGPPTVHIRMGRHGSFAVVQVEDEGPGFDPALEPHLFSRFVRGDSARPGTGLGLALSRAIARGHGGDVRLTSSGPGEGAIAEVWLPLAPIGPTAAGG